MSESSDLHRSQAEFVLRGLASLAEAERLNHYVDAEVALGNLERKLTAMKARVIAMQQTHLPNEPQRR